MCRVSQLGHLWTILNGPGVILKDLDCSIRRLIVQINYEQ